MTDPEVLDVFRQANAIITDSHIVYTSGRHGRAYVNKDALYVHTAATSSLCRFMAESYDANSVDVVAGPTVGGVVLSQWVAFHLNQRRSSGETLSIYAEEGETAAGKVRVFKRGYDLLIPGRNVVVVEDVVTTGGSAQKVIEAVKTLGGKIIGLSVLCNRGGLTSQDFPGVPFHPLCEVSLESFPEEDCPLCKDDVPVNTNVGKGKAFLEKRARGVI